MFESALIFRGTGDQDQIDIGLIAETLFFYGKTHLLMHRGAIASLATAFSGPDLDILLKNPNVQLTYLPNFFGVVSAGLPKSHQFISATIGAGKRPPRKGDYREAIFETVERALKGRDDAQRIATLIADKARPHRYSGDNRPESIIKICQDDLIDVNFSNEIARKIIRHLTPDYIIDNNFRFDLIKINDGYAIDTNIDFDLANEIYHKKIPPSHSTLSPAYIMSHFVTARADTFFSAYYMSEPVISPLYSEIIQEKHMEFLVRRRSHDNEIALFHDIILPNFPLIRESINNGDRSFSEFSALLEKADRFKQWIQVTNPNEGLVQHYHRSATSQTWADKLPTKSVRFAVATGLGAIADAVFPTGLGTAAGLAVGAADSLFLDKLIKGWRPNQFIASEYSNFLSPTKRSPP
ncbi:hypothetical protein E8L99_10840 [Phreatobacter aquaticus]|uniref:Uncharacterized protein n=1 Tax=Phreatobacter aquaticus TaxID=2570229 RepID=A0A4D7QLE7_9HYPH|nr:hypothetical protein [Phreatobacter aquaticus]QCK86216.1 hypothetical protein E8L99_10840 [Phreatobacter aquaticus]